MLKKNRVQRGVAATAAFVLSLALQSFAIDHEVGEDIALLTKQLSATPNNSDLLVQRAKLYVISEKYDAAVADLTAAKKIKATPEMDRELAQVYLASGKFDQAMTIVNGYLTQAPKDYEALLLRARTNDKLGRTDAASADYASSIAAAPQSSLDLYFERARFLTRVNRLTDALATINEAISKLGPVVTLETAALELEVRMKSYDSAITRLDQLIARMPRKDSWLAQRGDILSLAGRHDEARSTYQKALDEISKLPSRTRGAQQTAELQKSLQVLVDKSTVLKGKSALPKTPSILTHDEPKS